MKCQTQKLKWLLARIHLIESKLVPLRFTAQNRLTQINYTEEELDKVNGILRNALREIEKLNIRRWNNAKKR